MADLKINDSRNGQNLDDDIFLKALGEFLRKMRQSAGFSTIRSFVDTIDMSYSQYQGYETGKNITIVVLRRILFEFNIREEDWLKLDLYNLDRDDSRIINDMKRARIEQVIEQVKLSDDSGHGDKLGTKEAQRYIEILIFCNTAKSRSEILKNLLKMDDTVNTFKRVAGKLLNCGWLSRTEKESPNNPNQKYLTTELGKKAIKLS